MEIQLTINGEERTLEVSKTESLLDVLRRIGYTGTNKSCDTGSCSMCRVLVDGEPEAVLSDDRVIEAYLGGGA